MKTQLNNPENTESRSDKGTDSTNQEALDKASTNPVNRDDYDGIVGERTTGSNPEDIAGISDIDTSMKRGSRYSRRNK